MYILFGFRLTCCHGRSMLLGGRGEKTRDVAFKADDGLGRNEWEKERERKKMLVGF